MRDALNATGRRIYYSITQGVPYDDGPSRSKMHCYGESVFTTKPCAGRMNALRRAFILESDDITAVSDLQRARPGRTQFTLARAPDVLRRTDYPGVEM